ncbi:hypothetical protein Tco_0401331 [Tanacetum coccineum]
MNGIIASCVSAIDRVSQIGIRAKDPYEAIRQSYLDGTDTESEPFEDPTNTEITESPLAIAQPVLVPILRRSACMTVRVPHAMSLGLSASMAEVAAMSEFALRKRFWSSCESSPSVSLPDLPLRKRYHGTSELVEGSEEDDDEEDEEKEESMDFDNDETHGRDDKGRGINDEGHSIESDGLDLEEEESVPRGQRQAAPVVGTILSAPLGLGYRVLRCRELALEEGDVYNTFEVRQGSGSAPEFERPKRVSAFRRPTLTTWTDPEDDMIYIDIPDYPPPAPPIQTPPLPEWTSGSLPISLSHSDVPSPISSPMIPLTVPSPIATPATVETEVFLTELGPQVEMQGGLIHDHIVQLEELSLAMFERYDRDIRELFTRSGVVREEIFSQRYRFRSLMYEQDRVVVTFGAIWRPVLALEAWVGQTDAQRAVLWHVISDVQGENRDLWLQLAEERRARLELAEVVDGMRRGQEPRRGA